MSNTDWNLADLTPVRKNHGEKTANQKYKRVITIHIFKDGFHAETQVRSIYREGLAGITGIDPFEFCKTMKDIRNVLLHTDEGVAELEAAFKYEPGKIDFCTVKVNKYRLANEISITKEDYKLAKARSKRRIKVGKKVDLKQFIGDK